MRVREIDLRINRNNFPTGYDASNSDLKRRIVVAWKTYNGSDDLAVSEAAYGEWCRLVSDLEDLEA